MALSQADLLPSFIFFDDCVDLVEELEAAWVEDIVALVAVFVFDALDAYLEPELLVCYALKRY